MPTDTKHDDLQSLRIDHSMRDGGGEPSPWSRRFILGGIAFVVLLGLVSLAYRLFASDAPEVEVVRAAAEGSDVAGATVLSATGYVVAHHKINVNSKVTGRVAWIGVEKGDKVKEGQVVVRLEDQEFRALYEQAQGVVSKQALDDANARYDASQQRVNSLAQSFQMSKIGPRSEQIQRARGDLGQAQGQMDYAKSQLDATVIRAPVSGTILERTAEKGELVTAQFASGAEGGPRGSVVALADLNDIQVELDIAQDDFAKLGPKQEATVILDAFKDRSYKGAIAEISPEANRQKATVQVKVQIMNPDAYLRPEMNATVQFLANDSKTATRKQVGAFVPTQALRDKDGTKFVFIVFNGRTLRRDVHVLGPRSGGYLVDALVGGESVITSAPADLKDGQKIRIKGQS